MKVLHRDNLRKSFAKLGVKVGHEILVHSSMKSFGYFVNGPYDIVNSLYDLINIKKGTLLIPTHTGQMTNPLYWKEQKNYTIIHACGSHSLHGRWQFWTHQVSLSSK